MSKKKQAFSQAFQAAIDKEERTMKKYPVKMWGMTLMLSIGAERVLRNLPNAMVKTKQDFRDFMAAGHLRTRRSCGKAVELALAEAVGMRWVPTVKAHWEREKPSFFGGVITPKGRKTEDVVNELMNEARPADPSKWPTKRVEAIYKRANAKGQKEFVAEMTAAIRAAAKEVAK
jgi:hypothetical protein